jgi:MtN3 and saliva related transmembrane protein
MNYIDIIGLIAGAMGGLALFPQVLKVLKTKSTKDISREMFLLLAGSIFLWLIYGYFLNNYPIMIANFFGIIQSVIILYFKIKNQLNKPIIRHGKIKYNPNSPIISIKQCTLNNKTKLPNALEKNNLLTEKK